MNPLFVKDILTLLRQRRVAVIQALFVLVLAGVVLASWPQNGVLTMSAASEDDLLLGLILGQLVVLVLVVPGLAAVSIVAEREANTLEMLYASRLTATRIVIGKVLSAMAFPLILMIAGLPFVALLNYRGAVNADDLIWAYVILTMTAALLAMLSLAISALCQTSGSALVMTYLVVLGICGGVMVPAAIMLDSAGGLLGQVLHYARAISPVAAVLSLLRRDWAGDFAGRVKGHYPSHEVFIIAAAVVIAMCLVVLLKKLSRPPAEINNDERGAKLKAHKPFGSLNPIAAKERRTNQLSSGRWMIRIFYGMLVLSLLLSLMSLSGGTEHPDLLRYVFQVLVAFQVIAIAAVTPSLTAASISSEIESGAFESLRLTRMSGGKIFWGKFLPAFIPAILPVIALLPAYGTVCYLNPAYLRYLQYLLPIILLTVLFCCVLGLVCSSFAGSSARSTVTAYIIVAAVVVLPMLAWWAGDAHMIDNQHWVQWASLPSPLVMGLSLAPAASATALSSATPPPSPLPASVREAHEIIIAAASVVMLIIARLRLAFLLRRG